MGSEVIAKCRCGFDTRISIGGGMRNFMTTCYFPCLCEGCHNIVQVNQGITEWTRPGSLETRCPMSVMGRDQALTLGRWQIIRSGEAN
jgi:hypothetical protein